MYKILITIGLATTLLMSGCATSMDSSIQASYMTAESSIAKSKSEAIKAQANAIAYTIDGDSSELERYLAREQISNLSVTKSGIKAPLTGNDVALRAVGIIPKVVQYGVTGVIGYKVADGVADALKNGGTTEITAQGDVNNVREENHATNFGKQGTASMTRSEDDYSVKTEIIKEEKEEVEDTLEVEEITED